jgi:hypothetical protein
VFGYFASVEFGAGNHHDKLGVSLGQAHPVRCVGETAFGQKLRCRASEFVLFATYYEDTQMKKGEMGESCSSHGTDGT